MNIIEIETSGNRKVWINLNNVVYIEEFDSGQYGIHLSHKETNLRVSKATAMNIITTIETS